jgi:potassium-transporting ATPase KdpC subunit
MKLFRSAIIFFIVFAIITGIIYPFLVTIVGKMAFSYQASGSLLIQNDKVIGSTLIGQNFTDPKYFWGRPSATGSYPYNAMASNGSNLGPLNPALIEQIKNHVTILQQYPHPLGLIPVDLVTASASGLDPQISPAAALYQIPRIAQIRTLDEQALRQLVDRYTQSRQLGIFGEPRVNVLKLNLALDQMKK